VEHCILFSVFNEPGIHHLISTFADFIMYVLFAGTYSAVLARL